MEDPHLTPMYMVEVFTKPGLNTEEVRRYIISKTGMSPAIYDNGTHYVTNQKLTLEILKEISDSEEVIEVTGDYTGGLGGYGASHEHTSHENRFENLKEQQPPRPPSSSEKISNSHSTTKTQEREIFEHRYNKRRSNYRVAIYTVAGIIGTIALAGFIISGGMLPNSNTGIQSSSTSTDSIIGNEPGMIHGYVEGLSGLPAIGASVIAENLETGESTSAFVSLTGQYFIDLPPGTYEITVSFPNGATQVIDTFEITRGTAYELNFSYDE
jgi:carboxypeptidase family protein